MTTIIGARTVAVEAGVDVATVCRWARGGYLPAIGKLEGDRGAWLFDADAVRRHPLVHRPPAGVSSNEHPRPGGQ